MEASQNEWLMRQSYLSNLRTSAQFSVLFSIPMASSQCRFSEARYSLIPEGVKTRTPKFALSISLLLIGGLIILQTKSSYGPCNFICAQILFIYSRMVVNKNERGFGFQEQSPRSNFKNGYSRSLVE